MANSIDRTTHAGVIPTVWEPLFEFAAQQPRGVAEQVWDVSEKVQGAGNVYKLNILPALSVVAGFGSGDVRPWTVGGSVNYVASLSPSTMTMTLSLKQVGITIEPDVAELSVSDLADAYTPIGSEAMYQGVDIDAFNLYSEFNSSDNVGSATTNFTEADFLTALTTLLKNAKDKAMPGDTPIYGWYDLGQYDNVLGWSNIISASTRGEKGLGPVATGRVETVYGAKLNFTSNVISSSGRRNMLFMKKAIAYGRKQFPQVETDRQDLITKLIFWCIWGVKSVHSNTTYGGGGKDLCVVHLTA